MVLVVPLDLISDLDLLLSQLCDLLLYILVLRIFEEILVCIDHWLEDKALVGLQKALRFLIIRNPTQREYENFREFGDPGLFEGLMPRLPILRTQVDRTGMC